MRLNKWIVAGLWIAGFALAGAQHAIGYTVSDLYGTWTGTSTNQPGPTELVSTGIINYSAPPSFFDASAETITFVPSTQFAFGVEISGFQQTGASFSGDTVTWDTTSSIPVSGGGTVTAASQVWTGTLETNPANSAELLLTGVKTPSFILDRLPSDATVDGYVIDQADFSVTAAAPSGPSTVPLPPAAWSALAMLGGLAVAQYIRTRRRLA